MARIDLESLKKSLASVQVAGPLNKVQEKDLKLSKDTYAHILIYEEVLSFDEDGEPNDPETDLITDEFVYSYEELIEFLESDRDAMQSWVEWSSSPADLNGNDWAISEGEQNFNDGSETRYSLFIKPAVRKGVKFTKEQMEEISEVLGIRRAKFSVRQYSGNRKNRHFNLRSLRCTLFVVSVYLGIPNFVYKV